MHWVTKTLLAGLVMLSSGCAETSNDAAPLTVTIESQDNIVSENGALELTRGTLAVQSVSLIASAETVPLVGPVTIDLSRPAQELPLRGPIPHGMISGLRIVFAPPSSEGSAMMDVDLRKTETGETVRAISHLTIGGDTSFPEGPRLVTESSRVELHVQLRGMFFYLAPLSDAVDGVFEADETQKDFLTMDLIGMFDLRVTPAPP